MFVRALIAFASVVAAVVLLLASPAHAGIRVHRAKIVPGADQIAITHITLESICEDCTGSVNCEIVHPGTVEPADDGREYLANKQQTIIAINFASGSDISEVYLAVQEPHGKILVIPDLDQRVRDLCRSAHKPIDDHDLRAYKVSDNRISLYGPAFGNVQYDVTVRISSSGALRLVGYDREVEPPAHK